MSQPFATVEPKTALISYSHDSPQHEHDVLMFCNRLRSSGIDAFVDQFLAGAPSEGWPLWMERQIETRDAVLLVCTEAYRRSFMDEQAAGLGRGVVWEARILRNLLYEDSGQHHRFVPVLLKPEDRAFIPTGFRGQFYDVTSDAGFDALLRHLLGRPAAQKPAVVPAPPVPTAVPLAHEGGRWSAFEQPWLVPDAMRTRYFTGREETLERILRSLAERGRVAISGLGGVGKSQIALAFALGHRKSYPSGVFWVSAESPSALTGGFVEIAKTLRLSAAAWSDQEKVAKSTIEWLDRQDGWLLVLDNVGDRREIADYVPQAAGGHVIITSRETVFQELGIPRPLELVDFEIADSIKFLFKRAGRDSNDPDEHDAAWNLAKELGGLPLALEQAGAYIAENNATFADYLSSFRGRRVGLLERSRALLVHETVATTWSANFDAVSAVSPAAADVLRIGAFLAPDAIPFELLSSGAANLGEQVSAALWDPDDALAVGELLRPLARYSLIRTDTRTRTFGVHRLVQEILRAAMSDSRRVQYVERLVRALDYTFPKVEYATWAPCDRLIPHVSAVLQWIDAYDLRLDAAGRLLSRAGWYLSDRGRYAEARPLHERALAILEGALGPDHLDVARSLNLLANLYGDSGRFAEALPLYERALTIRERVLGRDHTDVAMILNNLALLHGEEGRYAEAQPLLERSLAIVERNLGRNHPSVAYTLNNLAWLYSELRRFDEAEQYAERALDIRERVLGADHPEVVQSLVVLAGVYGKQRRFVDARGPAERAVAIAENALGPEHPSLAWSLKELANVNCELGFYADARALAGRALAIRERALGPDHPNVAYCLNIIADAYVREGSDALALPLYRRALAIAELAFGASHREVAEIRRRLDALQVGPAGRAGA